MYFQFIDEMELASLILLIFAAILLFVDASMMLTHLYNPLKGLPRPLTLIFLGLGILLFSISQLLG